MAVPTRMILCFIAGFLLLSTANAKGLSPFDNLTSDLLDGYSVHNPPTHNRSTSVSLGITLHSVTDLDAFSGIFKAVVWQTLMWIDERLAWNPADHNDISVLRLPSDMIWKPDVILYNSVREFLSISEVHVIAYPDGTVYYNVPLTIEASCSVNLAKYPYDTQKCDTVWGSWVHDDSSLALTPNSEVIDLSFYTANPAWDLVETSMIREAKQYPCCAETYVDVTASVVLRRRHPDSHIASAVFANWMILVVFLIGPPCSGERIIFAGFIFLSLIVVSVSLNATVPWYTSTSVGRFTVFGLLMTAVITVLMALCYRLYPRQEPEPVKDDEPRHQQELIVIRRRRLFLIFDAVAFIITFVLLVVLTAAFFG